MATTLAGQSRDILTVNWDNTLGDDTVVRDGMSRSIVQELTDGTGAKKAQVNWHTLRTLTGTTSENLDLKALADGAFGVIALTKVKWFILHLITETSGCWLELGAAGGNDWAGASQWLKDATDIVRVCAGGEEKKTSPIDGFVVDATHKILKVNNPSGYTAVYWIGIVGEGTVT